MNQYSAIALLVIAFLMIVGGTEFLGIFFLVIAATNGILVATLAQIVKREKIEYESLQGESLF